MTQEMLALVLDFMKNGGDLPKASTAQQRYEIQAHLFKMIFAGQLALETKIDGVRTDLSERVGEIGAGLKEMKKHPSLLYLFRYETMKFVAFVGGFALFMLGLWLVLYVAVQSPEMKEILHHWANLPSAVATVRPMMPR